MLECKTSKTTTMRTHEKKTSNTKQQQNIINRDSIQSDLDAPLGECRMCTTKARGIRLKRSLTSSSGPGEKFKEISLNRL